MKTYPLLQSQLGVFMETLKDPSSTQYNIPMCAVLPKSISFDKIDQALQRIIHVRKELRTRFILEDGSPRQYCDDNMVIPILRKKMSDSQAEQYISNGFVRPYDLLSGEPLMRAELIEGERNNYVLFECQHAICDGMTLAPNLTLVDLPAAYRGEELIPNEYGMYDYALDEEKSLQSEQYERAKKYYTEKFEGIDFVSLAGNTENHLGMMVRKSAFISQQTVDEWCKQQGTQSNLLFMAAFSLVLSKLTRQSDVAYYSINHGRMDKRLRNAYGMFVKSVPILAKVSGQQKVMDFIKTFRTELMSSIRYNAYPFNHFCRDLHQEPRISFGFQGVAMQEFFELEEERCKPVQISKGRIDDDMSCVIYLKDGDYEIRMESSDALNSEDTLYMVANCIKACVEDMMEHPEYVLSEIKMLTPQEEQQILSASRGKTLFFEGSATFPSLFIQQAGKTPDANAVVDEQGAFTYSELNMLSGALALKLRTLGVGSSDASSPFVSIMLGYQKEFLVAAIGIEKAGGAYVPLDYDYPIDRLLYMLEDSESQVLITSHIIFDEKTGGTDNNFSSKNILFIEDFIEAVVDNHSGDKIADYTSVNYATPDGIAYMIYTSGSTGKPKGVMIPHRAKANFVQFIAKEWHHTPQSRICCHSSFSFDASVEDLYPVLIVGGTLYTVPQDARKDLILLHDFIVDNGITGGCYTTQLGQMLLQLYPDLPVDYLVVGGEKMTASPECKCRLINTYGPTEFTVDATFYDIQPSKEYKNIPIGRPLDNLSAYVVDQFGHLLPLGIAGELCMAGPQMASGYWKQDELTREKFSECRFVEGKIYHTGDLVRYNEDSQIEYLGRIDSQVKLRGFRIELGEIESLIAAYPDILMESVQVKEIGGVQHLCAYYTARTPIDVDKLKAYLAEKLTDYMVPTAYMQLKEMPLTPNGKVNTKALPLPEVKAEEIIAPETETEKKLFNLAAEMLKLNNFGVTTNLISMGLTSISSMRFSMAAYNEFGVQITIKDVMQYPSIRQLAAFIDNKREEVTLSTSLEAAELWPQGKHYYYPITENQRGVFLDWELHRDTTQYNIPEVHVFRGGDAKRLCEALKVVINAHPYLKTHFVQHDGDVMQIRRDEEEPIIMCEMLKEQPEEAFFQSRVRPFDLYHDTLYRLEVYSYGLDVYLFMDIHHSIYDGASSLFLLSDIKKAYDGESVEEENYTAFDFALDEYKLTNSAQYTEAESYFKNMLEGKDSTVYPHSSNKNDSDGTVVNMTIEGQSITPFCQDNGLTPNSYFLTVLMHVLQTVTWNEDVVITTINNGRSDPRTMGIMGMFVKTIPAVWSAGSAKEPVADAVKRMQEQLLETQSRDFYPFTKMVELYGLRPEIMYVYQPVDESSTHDEDNMILALNQTKLPLDIDVMPQGDNYIMRLEFDKNLYSRQDIECFANMVKNVAQGATGVEKLQDVPFLSEADTASILRLSKGEQKSYDLSKTFIETFSMRAVQQPDAIAVSDENSQYTYAELDHCSNALAHLLVEEGVKPNDFVCVFTERSKEFVLAVHAIHKAGAAYTPLDIDYPLDRLQYMLDDSEAKVLLTIHKVLEEKRKEGFYIDESKVKVILIDDLDLHNAKGDAINLTTPDNVAYMIYTSGSTGKPKGAMLHQRGLMNFTCALAEVEQLTPNDRVASHRSFSFDSHIGDLFPVLYAGGQLHIMPSAIRKDLDAIHSFLIEREITGFGGTTSLMMMLINHFDLPLRFITAGGEKLFDVKSDKTTIINLYGPTECTDDSTLFVIKPGEVYNDIPIGRPLPNVSCYVLDSYGHILPQGVAGELCIGGVQVGYGYWKMPEKTASAFVSNPFGEGKLYHTGDLVRYNADGQIEYIGRIDDQVKLRGFRIELGEIESTTMQHPAVQQAVALVKTVSGNRHLVLYYTCKEGMQVSDDELSAYLDNTSLAKYMLPEIYMRLEEIPRLPNGKINRRGLPVPIISVGEITEAESELEAGFLNIIKELLKNVQIGTTTNLISAGMTSLTAMRLSAVAKQKLNFFIPTKEILLHPTVREMIISAGVVPEKETTTHEKQDYYPITENQRGLYIDWELNSDAVQYNIPEVIPMDSYSAEQVHDALLIVMDAHPYLKTHLVKKDGDVMQQRRDDAPATIIMTTLSYEPTQTDFEQRVKPFNLLGEDLYRFEIIQTPSRCFLFVDIHHIINDGASRVVFSEALRQALEHETVATETYTAFDYALDEKEWLESEKCKEAESYFDNLLSNQSSTVYPHSTEGTEAKGLGTYEFTIPGNDIDAFCRQISVTSYAFFATMLSQLLHRVTRDETILFSTIDNGRSDSLWMQSIGMFVKTLPVTSILDIKKAGNTKIADAVKQMHQQLMMTCSLSFYPFTRMSERHSIRPEILYVYHGKLAAETNLRENVEEVKLDLDTVKMPLTVTIYSKGGDDYTVLLTYNPTLYAAADMQRLAEAFKSASLNALDTPSLATFSMLSENNRHQLDTFKYSSKKEIPWKLFYQPIEENAVKYADCVALVAKDRTLTFLEFNVEANRVAHALIRKGVKRGDRVVLLLPRRSAVIVCMFGISKTGAAYIPCDPEYPADRINLIMSDSEAQYIITTKEHATDYQQEKVILVDELYNSGKSLPGDDKNPKIKVQPEDLAYLIYTSGSTGRPKGVMLRHIGIANYLYDDPANVHIHGLIELGVKTFVSITTLSFDMSLKEFAGSLFNGITCVLADEQEVMDAQLLADLMKRTGAEAINGTCSRIMTYMELGAFREALSHCKTVWAGGEKFPMQLLTSLQSMGVHIFNTYGPTEITVSSNIADLTIANKVTVGHPLLNYEEFIVDQFDNELPAGFVGELLIGGPGVALGYNNLPEMTAERFVDYQGVRVYRSGDLARWEPNGEVEILGRNDGQVKLRGFRVELGEIEGVATKFPGIRQAVADIKEVGVMQHLCLYYTSNEELDEEALRAFLAESLTEYMVPTAYVRIDAIPLTPNGKTNRKALPAPIIKAAEIVPPANKTEQQLLDIAIELLKHDQFGVTTNLISVGLTSLSAMRLSAMIQNSIGKNVPMRSIFQEPTLRHIASIIDGNEEIKDIQIVRIHEQRDYYPITENQRGVYVAWELNRDTTQYNLPHLRKYSGIRVEDLRDALVEVVDAHPILKARMAIVDGDVMQQRRDNDETVVSVTLLKDAPTESFFQSRVRPFDLQNDNLYRLEIYQYEDNVYLFMDFHHIVFDGNSTIVFESDLQSILNNLPTKEHKIDKETYTAYDRALDEQEMRESSMYATAEKYFDTLLSSFEIASYPASRQLDKSETGPAVVSAMVAGDAVNGFCSANGVTANSFFMTSVTQVLHRMLREDDLMISAISTGRFTVEMQNIVGFFVQTLPVVTHSSNVSVKEAVKAMQQQYIDTQANSIFSYTKAVEKYGCRAEILFAFQPAFGLDDDAQSKAQDDDISLRLDTVKMPILISILENKAGYRIDVDYDASRYSRADMTQFVEAVKRFAECASKEADSMVNVIPLTSAKEKQKLLALGKGEILEHDTSLTLVDLIRQQAVKTPEATAIVFRDKRLTYRELDEQTDRLACCLLQMGVKPEEAVGVMIERSELMAVYPIAIMKAGATYMPLDSHFPEERLQFMCDDAGVSLILANDGIVSQAMPHYSGKVFCASELESLPAQAEKPVVSLSPDNMFVILYTSGSTGKPKGCILEHGNIVNFCRWYVKEFNVTQEDRAVAYANFGFDAHMMDLYPALSVGASVYIIPSELRMDLVAMNKYMEEQQLTIAFMTTQIGYMFATSIENHSLRLLSVGGEKLQPLKKPRFRFYNGYGPTECTLYSTCYNITKDYNSSLIGRPLANYQLRIVDKHMNLVPRGVPGELVVMGAGVGRGYLNRSDMNAEKFIIVDKQRAYRTGDLVRWSDDGNIDYLGRIDGQVKLRGLRIELGEIESRVAEHEAVKQVCVDVKEIGSVQNLVCYYVEKEGYNVNEEALKAWIGETLTAFMVPEFYVKMDKLPFTPNGKVNRRELPIPEAKDVEIVAPETKTEQKLFDIAFEMLKTEQLGVTTSLISYGLTSLTAMRLSALLQQRLMVVIPVAELLSHPTIREIATMIDSGQVKSTKVADIFTKRAPQTGDGATAPKGNPLAPKGNPMVPKGNPMVPKGNPMVPKGNPMVPKGNPLSPKGNPMAPKANPLQSNNNKKE